MTRYRFAALCLLAFGCGLPTPSDTATQRSLLTSGSLPGGTNISVGITSPTNGAVVPAAPLPVTGTAEVGVAPPVPTDMVMVMDISGSTGSSGGCGADQNGDGVSNTVLDCEIAALRAVNDQLVTAGSVQHVGVVAFSTNAFTADMQPGAGDQRFTDPAADLNGNAQRDVDEVLTSANSTTRRVNRFTSKILSGSATSYGAALSSLAAALSTSTATRKVVVMVSDGLPNVSPSVASTIGSLPPGTIVSTIAAGNAATCGTGVESLQYIADHTGGTCIHVTDLSLLPDLAPALVKSSLTGITVTVDGAPTPLDSVSAPLPQDGPASVSWTATANGLTSGLHQICATAHGVDIGGGGDVTECVDVTVNSPPVAVCAPVTVPADAMCQATASVNAGSSDPDGNLAGCTEAPPAPYGLGATSVTLTCTDTLGESDSCSAAVTVVDLTPPTFTSVPGPICTHRACISVGTATATDNCGPATVTNDAPTRFPCGVTVVTWTATDAAGNATTATQQVTRACRGHHSGHGGHGNVCGCGGTSGHHDKMEDDDDGDDEHNGCRGDDPDEHGDEQHGRDGNGDDAHGHDSHGGHH